MLCPKCGAQLSDSAVICRACGAMLPEQLAVPRTCAQCGAPLESGVRFLHQLRRARTGTARFL